jgi:Zn-finger nucleic acid-binding protein
LWISHAHFESIVNSVKDRFADSRAPHSPPATSGWDAVVYRKCPECSAFMHRKNFEQISGIILDECRAHGRWLDAHELEAVARFVSAGGLRRAAERAKEQADRAKEQAVMERATSHVSNLLLEPEGPRPLEFLLERLAKIFAR